MADGIGFGLVWGWLLGGPNMHSEGMWVARSTPVAMLATAIWVGSAAGPAAVAGFLAGVAAAMTARLGWRRWLVRRMVDDHEEGVMTDG